MVVSGSAWPAVTSAPVVTIERPMRPVIGALTCVNSQIDLARCRARRARARQLAPAESAVGLRVEQILLADHARLRELGEAVRRARGAASRVATALARSARAWPGGGFVDARIDAVEHVARVHRRALGEQPRLDDARHLRPHFGGLERGRAARQLQRAAARTPA